MATQSKRTLPTGPEREPAPKGTHLAVCIQVIDLGTQKVSYIDKETKEKKEKDTPQIQLAFQLVNEWIVGEDKKKRAVVVYKTYTYSGHASSNLYQDLKVWLGLDSPNFDVEDCLGEAAQITITHNKSQKTGKVYDNVTAITALMKGTKAPKATEPMRSLFLDNTFDETTFKALGNYVKSKIMESKEYKALQAAKEGKGAGKAANAKGSKKK
jgi:hypothetical protein